MTYSMPAPLANRFSHFEVETHLDDWVLWAYANGIDERVIAFLRFRPEWLFDFDPAHNPVAFPSPRSWEFAHRSLRKFEAQPDLLQETLQSCVGAAAGIELHAFLASLDQLPDLEVILAGGQVPIPREIDLQYAVAAALVGRALRLRGEPSAAQAIGHILAYAGRFPQREMGVMLVSDLHRAIGQALFEIPAFADWAQSVSEVMLFD